MDATSEATSLTEKGDQAAKDVVRSLRRELLAEVYCNDSRNYGIASRREPRRSIKRKRSRHSQEVSKRGRCGSASSSGGAVSAPTEPRVRSKTRRRSRVPSPSPDRCVKKKELPAVRHLLIVEVSRGSVGLLPLGVYGALYAMEQCTEMIMHVTRLSVAVHDTGEAPVDTAFHRSIGGRASSPSALCPPLLTFNP